MSLWMHSSSFSNSLNHTYPLFVAATNHGNFLTKGLKITAWGIINFSTASQQCNHHSTISAPSLYWLWADIPPFEHSHKNRPINSVAILLLHYVISLEPRNWYECHYGWKRREHRPATVRNSRSLGISIVSSLQPMRKSVTNVCMFSFLLLGSKEWEFPIKQGAFTFCC